MTAVLGALLGALDRVNRRHPWSHNAFFTPRIVREARRARRSGATTALDLGCGTGALLLELRRVLPSVTGLEPDAATAARAEALTARRDGVRVVRGALGAGGGRPPGIEPADLVTAVAVLHHLPLRDGIRAARDLVAPGGRLVIVGVADETRADLTLLSLALNPVIGMLRHPRVAVRPPEAMTAPTADAADPFPVVRDALHAELPGVRVRRALFWRYVAVWVREG